MSTLATFRFLGLAIHKSILGVPDKPPIITMLQYYITTSLSNVYAFVLPKTVTLFYTAFASGMLYYVGCLADSFKLAEVQCTVLQNIWQIKRREHVVD